MYLSVCFVIGVGSCFVVYVAFWIWVFVFVRLISCLGCLIDVCAVANCLWLCVF